MERGKEAVRKKTRNEEELRIESLTDGLKTSGELRGNKMVVLLL